MLHENEIFTQVTCDLKNIGDQTLGKFHNTQGETKAGKNKQFVPIMAQLWRRDQGQRF